MTEEKTNQVENSTETSSVENKDSDNQNQNYERLMKELQILKEQILNTSFVKETKFKDEQPEEKAEEKAKTEFKLK